jgi:hypothetical protein
MSHALVRWTTRTVVAAVLLVGTAVLGAGVSSADGLGGGQPPDTGNGTSWTPGTVH